MDLSANSEQRVIHRRQSIHKMVALACVILLALLAIAQVVHTHRTSSDADHCALCVVLHSAVPVAAAAAVVVFALMAFNMPAQKSRRITRYWHAQLFNRPPPMVCMEFFGVA